MTQTQPPFGAQASNGSGRDAGADYGHDTALHLRETLMEAEARVSDFVRSHPVPVVFGALALGFVVARWMRKP